MLQSMESQRVGHDRAIELNSTSNAGGMGSIHGQGTKIPHSSKCIEKKKIQKTKTIFSLSAVQKEVLGWMWLEGCSLLSLGLAESRAWRT